MASTLPELPGQLRLTPSFPFVGRLQELAMLRALMPRTGGEGRRVALIGGEPGSGKSRLVREFSREVAGEGALVLYGACDAVVRTPYRPFVEALDYLIRIVSPASLRADLGLSGGELARLLPRLPVLVRDLPSPVAADPDTERHRLHTAVTDLLSAVSRRQPVLLVLEDGHWADAPTLLLLRHLGRAAADARMLLIATFRDTEAEVPEDLSAALVDLRRSDGVARVRLGGLTDDDIAEFVRAAAGEASHGLATRPELVDLAGAISELTGGNAFLMTELWRTLLETGALEMSAAGIRLTRPLDKLGTPEGVRELVSQRLTRLAPGTTDLLELAAVIGPVFEARVLERASSLAKSDLIAALDEAVRSGIVEEVSALGLSYRFAHELVRRALFDRLTAAGRAELHLRVAEALETVYARELERVLPDLAYHFASAAPLGDVGRAIEYSLRAARAAQASLAFDQAVAHLHTALELGIADRASRASAFLEAGAANHLAGRSYDSLEAFATAAEIARDLTDAGLLARAAVGYENACWRPGIADRGAVELLEEAAEVLGDHDSELRVRVLSGLSRALANRGEHGRAGIVRTSAIGMARRLDDRHGLATVLMRSYWTRGTNTLEEILEMLNEAEAIAEELGDIEIQAETMEWRLAALIGLGQLEAAQRELEVVRDLASRMGQPFILHVAEHYASTIALCQGRLADADAAAERSHEWSRLMTGRDASGVYGIQMFGVRREQGRLAELAPVVRVLAGGAAGGRAWGPGLAAMLAELGMEHEARDQLGRIAAGGLESLRESPWLASLTYLADASAAVGEEKMAALVYPELEPYAGTNVMIGYGVACYGAADRHLGMLATTLGEWELAQERFEVALDINRSMGAVTWLAHTGYEYGRMLLARRRPEDRRDATALLGEAAGLAERIGMPALLARIHALRIPVAERGARTDGLSPREEQILRLVARGLSNREIGRELVISEHTAANHVRAILRKTRCANRTEAATYAHRHGLAEP
jgi:DNA-binding CsgD family transcriptional regulator/tetratricopeptide (TPR) repeat protein